MIKNCFTFSSDEEQNGSPKPSHYWWRSPQEFDEDGHFKMDISDPANSSPRIKLLIEMERLGFIGSAGLNDLRHKILSYRAGDFCLPIGGIEREDMEIPPLITILLTGLTASGKSSFINLMYGVLGRFGLIPFAQTSGESSNFTTMYLEEHNVLRSPRSGFCVYDTRGLDQNHMEEGLEEVSTWMNDGVRHHQPCKRAGDENIKGLTQLNESMEFTNSRYINRKVNFVMVVADLSEIHRAFKSGDLEPIVALRTLFHFPPIKNSNENPILILTHGDTLSPEDRIKGRLQICEYMGIPETNGVYDIPCLTEQWVLAEDSDPISAYALTEAVYKALLQADRAHPPKWRFKEWTTFIFAWTMWCLASLFSFLAQIFGRFGNCDGRLRNM
ncbi:hypothetical protein AAHA92_16425 [Salvia divinorum]|uniref:Uncharacterized protein n=1 Tax=Salvia divinorum TaxID=28513 RepID=A0ABD1GVL5_SALDI